jgi:hypothetical protein
MIEEAYITVRNVSMLIVLRLLLILTDKESKMNHFNIYHISL